MEMPQQTKLLLRTSLEKIQIQSWLPLFLRHPAGWEGLSRLPLFLRHLAGKEGLSRGAHLCFYREVGHDDGPAVSTRSAATAWH